jgi:hypothetical protein
MDTNITNQTNQVNTGVDIKELNERIQKESSFVDLLTMEMRKVIVGQKHLIDSLLIGLLYNAHFIGRSSRTCKNIGNKYTCRCN